MQENEETPSPVSQIPRFFSFSVSSKYSQWSNRPTNWKKQEQKKHINITGQKNENSEWSENFVLVTEPSRTKLYNQANISSTGHLINTEKSAAQVMG